MRIRSKVQKCMTGLAAMTLAFGMIAGGVAESTQVHAENTETLYVVNQEFTSVNSMVTGKTYVFVLASGTNGGRYTAGQAIAGIPKGSATLRYRGSSRPSGWTKPSISDTQGYVDVVTAGTGFDSCEGGGIRYENGSWKYACNGGGVKYDETGPFYVYSYTSYTYTANDVSASLNLSSSDVQQKISQGSFTVTTKDLTMKVTVGGKIYTVPEYTVDSSDSSMNLLAGDNTVRVKVGDTITKTITLNQEATPNAKRVSSGECQLENLEAGAEYLIIRGGQYETVTADANGRIDISSYTGQTIQLAKQGVDAKGTVVSIAQTISLPARETISALSVDTVNGRIQGLAAGAEYTLTIPDAGSAEGTKTVTVTADANGQIDAYPYAGTALSVVKNSVGSGEGRTFDSSAYTLQVPAQYEVPTADVDTGSGKLTGLTSGASYEISYTEGTVTEIADAEGQIDAASYAGKDIQIRKLGDGNQMTSEVQTISVPKKYMAPTVQPENKNGVLAGLEPGQIYQIEVKDEEGNITEIRDVKASADGTIDIQEYAGKNIDIRRKGDENTQVSAPISITVPKREAVPETRMNTEGGLDGLTPGETYWIQVDDQKLEVTPKVGEVIDVSRFAGKTITVTKAGGDSKLPSVSQTITIPERNSTPTASAFKSGNVKGLEPNTTYKIYIDQQWTEMTTDAEGTLALTGHEGSTIQIVRLGDNGHTVSLPQIITIPERGTPTCEGTVRVEESKYDSKLNNDSASLIEAVFTKEEQEMIYKGADSRVYLELKTKSVEISEADRTKIEAVLDNYKIAGYIDISCYKQLIRDGVEEAPVKVSVTNGNRLSVTIKIPEEYQNTDKNIVREYRIVRYHEGEAYAEVLPTVYNSADGTLTFETDKFSTYAIVYEDKAASQTQSPKTGDSAPVYLIVILAMLSAAGMLGLKKTAR